MSDPATMNTSASYVRDTLAPQRPAPIVTTGMIGFLRTRLFGSPLNIALTLISALCIWFFVVPALRFMLVDAVWTGTSRESCLAATSETTIGACWPFIAAKFGQFMYGFYPEAQRWRVNLALIIGVLLLIPLLIPRAPAKSLNAGLFFLAFPVLAFFLMYGGGLSGFGLRWLTGFGDLVASSLIKMGKALELLGYSVALEPMQWVLIGIGVIIEFVGLVVIFLFAPVAIVQAKLSGAYWGFWADFAITAIVGGGLLVWLRGGLRNGWRALIFPCALFAGVAIVVLVMGLDRGGLPIVDTRQWGGMLVTMVVSITGIVASMPIGIALALGRRSTLPIVRYGAVAFIEFWRGVPLITVLFFATYMLPLFMPGNLSVDALLRVLIGVALFAGAYNAEVIRGGLQAIPRGQYEAASALGLSYWKSTRLIVLPQALRHVIPGLVNSFIALFKDTTLVLIVAILDLLGQLRTAFSDPAWATPTTLFTGFAFAGIIYFVLCFGMSRYSLFVERRVNAFRQR